MKKYILILATLISAFAVHANPIPTDANIFGHVVNNKTGEHISFINVVIKNTTIGAATDATGHYALKNLPEGKFILAVEGIGYKPQERTVEIKKGKTLEINFEIEEDILKLNEVVVTAGRSSQKRTEAPVIVNTISTKMLETTQSVVLGEGLNFCTGLRYENDCQNCGFSQIRMNGMEGPYSQILINSRPIFSGLAGVYGLELIPSNMLDRIEVVRGGGSVLYGSNAIAGTINLILKDPKTNSFEAGFNTSLIGTGVSGSNGPRPDYNATFNASLVTDDNKSGIAVFGNMRDRKMFDANGDEFSEIAPMKNTVIGTRIFHRPAYRSKLSLDFFNISEERNGGNRQEYPHHERDISESVKHDMKTGALTFEQYMRESDMLSVFASGQYLDRDSYYGANRSKEGYGNTKDKTYNVGAQYKAILNDISSVIGGVEHTGSYLTDKKLSYNDDETESDMTIVSDQSLSTTGAFAQYEIKVGKARFLAGARVEHYSIDNKEDKDSDKSGTVLVPRASIMYDLTPYLQTRLGFSRGYRAPQIFDEDLHVNTSGSRQVIHKNDPNLKQENSSSFTLSFDFNKQLGGLNTNILVEGFYNKLHNPFRNEMGEPDENGTVIYTRYNSKGGAIVQGVNLEAKLMPSDKLSFTAGFTLQSSKYKEPDVDFGKKEFFRTPDTYGFLAMDWEFARNFGVSVTGNYTGKMLVPYFGPEIVLTPEEEAEGIEKGELRKSKSFFDAGIKFHYDMRLTGNVTVEWFAGMKNIFNSYQKDFDKGIDRDPSYIYGPSLPRTVFMGFRIGNLL